MIMSVKRRSGVRSVNAVFCLYLKTNARWCP